MLTYDLSEKGNLAIYEYLYQCIKEDIINGRLAGGAKLPSKRKMAQQHQVSLKTVENAYEQLLLEGYITAKEKQGYFVMETERRPAGMQNTAKTRIRSYAEQVAGRQEKESLPVVDLTSNRAAIEKFPYDTWAKVMREVLSDRENVLLDTVPFAGVYELRAEIARYLYEYRGMDVAPEQIIIGAGTEYLYGRLLQLLGRDSIYAIEDPGYHRFAKIYQANALQWRYVEIDEEGIRMDSLRQCGANVVHVSPGHHFPTGIIMPVGRRQEILDWAEEELGRYIIEDDYDSEFRFCKRPIPSIQSMDKNHRVIYFNTFSKTIAPSIRISYMVLPTALMDRYVSTMNFYACTVSAFEQYALAKFMRKGYFDRHIHRMKNFYRNKRDKILEVLQQSPLCERVEILEKGAGNHFLMRVTTDLSDTELKWIAAQNSIRLDCLSEYCVQNKEKYAHTIIVNYSDIEEESFRWALGLIAQTLEISCPLPRGGKM